MSFADRPLRIVHAESPPVAEPAIRTAIPGRLQALAVRRMAVALAASVLIFLLALVPRLAALDAYVTIDESRWIQRAADFSTLIAQRDDEDTFIIGHPGVTTMWTAALGMGPERVRAFSFLEGRADVTRRDGYFDALLAARRPFAVLAALGVVAVTLLGWRLLGAGPALVGGLLLALEPFLVAHARVVHLDSMLATYSTVCLLAALVYWQAGGGPGYLLLSGVAAGLAFLTKAPSIFVIGFVLLVALADLTPWPPSLKGRGEYLPLPFREGALGKSGLSLALWGLVALAVCLLLWPALRVDPVGTLLKMVQFTERVGGGEHDNFFFGRSLEDPGPLFYPLALAFRLAPLTLLSLVLAGLGWRTRTSGQRRTVLTLGAYCLGFVLMMSLAPKKFDRYLLPIFPLLGLIAGLGLWTAARWAMFRVGDRNRGAVPTGGAVRFALIGLVVIAQAAPLLAVHPYALAYYNPLLGGGAVAERAILVGWGEGLDRVAAYLNAQPRPLGLPTVATSYHRVLQAHLEGSAVPLERVRMADYVVPYVNTLQRGAEREVLAFYLDRGVPELVVQINGIEYARVYRGPRFPRGGPLTVQFGGRLTLAEFLAAPGEGSVHSGEEIAVSLHWDGASAPNGDERVAVLLVGRDGRSTIQDERPVGADGPDKSGRLSQIHRLTVPPRTAPGEYRLVMRVTDPRARASLPVTGGTGVGADELTLRTIVVE